VIVGKVKINTFNRLWVGVFGERSTVTYS